MTERLWIFPALLCVFISLAFSEGLNALGFVLCMLWFIRILFLKHKGLSILSLGIGAIFAMTLFAQLSINQTNLNADENKLIFYPKATSIKINGDQLRMEGKVYSDEKEENLILTYYFKTKEEIYIAVLEKLSAEIKDALETLVSKPTGSLINDLTEILRFLRVSHPANFSIMRHDMTYEISEDHHYLLYRTWQASYLEPIVRLFDYYLDDNTSYTSDELARFFYSTIAPFIQKDNRFYKEVEAEKIVYIFVNGIYK